MRTHSERSKQQLNGPCQLGSRGWPPVPRNFREAEALSKRAVGLGLQLLHAGTLCHASAALASSCIAMPCCAVLRCAVLQDVQLMRSLGYRHFRFSLSWSRIIPQGAGPVSQARSHAHFAQHTGTVVERLAWHTGSSYCMRSGAAAKPMQRAARCLLDL